MKNISLNIRRKPLKISSNMINELITRINKLSINTKDKEVLNISEDDNDSQNLRDNDEIKKAKNKKLLS